jgi:hypothetical protein
MRKKNIELIKNSQSLNKIIEFFTQKSLIDGKIEYPIIFSKKII